MHIMLLPLSFIAVLAKKNLIYVIIGTVLFAVVVFFPLHQINAIQSSQIFQARYLQSCF